MWCCAFAVDDEPIKLWVPGDPVPAEFIEAARNPDWLVSTFNDGFERQIESHMMGPRYGWPVIPLERHRCTQAASLSLSLQGSLEGVAEALSVEQQKDREGRALMLKMAKGGVWPETDKERLYAYCRQDVATERDVHARVGHLGPEEQKLWVLDAQINDRGSRRRKSRPGTAEKSTERSSPVVPTFEAASQGFQQLGVAQPPQLVKSG